MKESLGTIPTQCDFTSHFLSLNGAKMHYYDEGTGDPILFLHGMPTSAYLWRNIIPALKSVGRCIAPDLMGMGKSDKPKDCEYRIFDHITYLDAFIEQMDLNNITLVLHGWGSLAGFDYARRHPEKIKAIAFYESHIKPITDWRQLSLPVQQLATLLSHPKASYRAIVEQNYLIEKLLPAAIIRPLTSEELSHYREPFKTEASRAPLWQYVNDLPLGDGPSDVVDLVEAYSAWLQKTDLPKLLLYAVPGFITPIDMVQWAKANLSNLTMVSLNDALHFAQESVPDQFAKAIVNWHKKLS